MCMNRKSQRVTYWFIFLYFAILFTERTLSIVFSLREHGFALFSTWFGIYTYGLVIVALVISCIVLLTFNWSMLRAMFSRNEKVYDLVNARSYSVLVGIILAAGMIHTEYTLVWLQFIAYGILIIGLIIATVNNLKHDKTDTLRWISLFYLIAYSMAIPVVYETKLPNAMAFHIVEAAASLIMTGIFSFFAYKVFAGKAGNLLYVEPLHISMFLVIAVLWMRWPEERNYFLLVSMGVAIVLWTIGKYIKVDCKCDMTEKQ